MAEEAKASEVKFSATISARALYALEPLVRGQDTDRFGIRGVFVEPHPDGGAVIAATDGRVIAAIRDPDGGATCARRLTISDRIFAACEPVKPVRALYEGDYIDHDVPDWMQPGTVLFTTFSAMVFPKKPHPDDEDSDCHLIASEFAETGNVHSGDYRIHEDDKPVDWRRALKRTSDKLSRVMGLDPRRLAQFNRVCDLYAEGSIIRVRMGGVADPILISIEGQPDFIGAIMPMRNKVEDFDLPSWLAQPEVAANGGKEG